MTFHSEVASPIPAVKRLPHTMTPLPLRFTVVEMDLFISHQILWDITMQLISVWFITSQFILAYLPNFGLCPPFFLFQECIHITYFMF